ncbi:unnamed protein product [Durusdinium trenchii]|uniref:EF-hand domain-containing protein n=2 Tax=Durusdinium trenchii TaxID=1381693 RepID=A0ABP0MZU7_9DINO
MAPCSSCFGSETSYCGRTSIEAPRVIDAQSPGRRGRQSDGVTVCGRPGCPPRKEKYFRAVRRLFTQLDQNSDGGITRKEFERAWKDPVLQTVFDALEISSTDAWDLFRQLDRDGSGEVDVDEFLEGCMMIKGPARSIDVVCIKKDLIACDFGPRRVAANSSPLYKVRACWREPRPVVSILESVT